MRYTRLGDSRLQVSRLCLGLENLYVHRIVSEQDAISILDNALERGAKFYRSDQVFHEWHDQHREKLDAYRHLCRENGYTQAEVSLAWLLHNPVVTAPIVGPRTVVQLRQLTRAAGLSLNQELLDKLDVLFPSVGGGGPAPEAYAW